MKEGWRQKWWVADERRRLRRLRQQRRRKHQTPRKPVDGKGEPRKRKTTRPNTKAELNGRIEKIFFFIVRVYFWVIFLMKL